MIWRVVPGACSKREATDFCCSTVIFINTREKISLEITKSSELRLRGVSERNNVRLCVVD